MTARVAADLVVALHFAFIVFAVLGGVLVLRWRWVAIFHLPCAVWAVLVEFAGWICPLTLMEDRLREEAGSDRYAGGFVDHYILPIVYPDGLTRRMQMAIGVAVLVFNVCVYGWAFRSRAWSRPSPARRWCSRGSSTHRKRTGTASTPRS